LGIVSTRSEPVGRLEFPDGLGGCGNGQAESFLTLPESFVSQAPLFAGAGANGIAVPPESEEHIGDDPADAEIVEQIKELIETRVRPAVAQDGGDIAYRGYRDGRLLLSMHGACSGCPSSTITLKRGIESLIRHYVPEVESVEAV